LGIFSELQIGFRTGKTEATQGKTEYLVGFSKYLLCEAKLIAQILPHANGL